MAASNERAGQHRTSWLIDGPFVPDKVSALAGISLAIFLRGSFPASRRSQHTRQTGRRPIYSSVGLQQKTQGSIGLKRTLKGLPGLPGKTASYTCS